jgi:hypothetical protein
MKNLIHSIILNKKLLPLTLHVTRYTLYALLFLALYALRRELHGAQSSSRSHGRLGRLLDF